MQGAWACRDEQVHVNRSDARKILRPLVKGLITFAPGLKQLLPKGRTHGTDDPYYAYDVWLKHLTTLSANGLKAFPTTVAEIGPGDSLGTGIAAMLSGVDHYYALDVVQYSSTAANLRVFDGLLELFRARAPRRVAGWPQFDQYLDESLFPSAILTKARLEQSLASERVDRIRALLAGTAPCDTLGLRYIVPWDDPTVVQSESIDVVISQSVLEHVQDLDKTYAALERWLRPGAMMSHQIDFSAHGLSNAWNGYRGYPELLWRLMLGRRDFLINREPVSSHIEQLRRSGLEIVSCQKNYRTDGIARSELSSRWQSISDDDLNCCGAFLQARKRLFDTWRA
jgi:hypothetical protein